MVEKAEGTSSVVALVDTIRPDLNPLNLCISNLRAGRWGLTGGSWRSFVSGVSIDYPLKSRRLAFGITTGPSTEPCAVTRML